MPNLTVYFPEQLHQQLRQRGLGDGENVVKRDLERYYALLELSLKRVAFSEAEWDYLRDAMNGIIFSQELIPYLPRALADSVKDASFDGLGEKWGVDVDALVEKILRLSPTEALAVVDAVECFWEGQK